MQQLAIRNVRQGTKKNKINPYHKENMTDLEVA